MTSICEVVPDQVSGLQCAAAATGLACGTVVK